MDISPEELHNSIKSEVAVHSDIKPFAEALTQRLDEKKFSLQPEKNSWWQALQEKQKKNAEFVEVFKCFLYINICPFKYLNTSVILMEILSQSVQSYKHNIEKYTNLMLFSCELANSSKV